MHKSLSKFRPRQRTLSGVFAPCFCYFFLFFDARFTPSMFVPCFRCHSRFSFHFIFVLAHARFSEIFFFFLGHHFLFVAPGVFFCAMTGWSSFSSPEEGLPIHLTFSFRCLRRFRRFHVVSFPTFISGVTVWFTHTFIPFSRFRSRLRPFTPFPSHVNTQYPLSYATPYDPAVFSRARSRARSRTQETRIFEREHLRDRYKHWGQGPKHPLGTL